MSGLFDDEIEIVVPLIPPSVNHYKDHRIVFSKKLEKNIAIFYPTKETNDFKEALATINGGRRVVAAEYEISARIYLGKRQRGDADNFGKVVGDSLKDAGVIHSDAAVKRNVIEVDRDWDNPRTVIKVRPFQGYRGL